MRRWRTRSPAQFAGLCAVPAAASAARDRSRLIRAPASRLRRARRMRPSLLIYNPAAGQHWRRPEPEHVVRELARHGWSADLRLTRGQDHATELVRTHLEPR